MAHRKVFTISDQLEAQLKEYLEITGDRFSEYVRTLIKADLKAFEWDQRTKPKPKEPSSGVSGAPKKDPVVKLAQEKYAFAMERYTRFERVQPHKFTPDSIGVRDRDHLRYLYEAKKWQDVINFCKDSPWNRVHDPDWKVPEPGQENYV